MANQEAENSEDMAYVNRILMANELMKQVLPEMIRHSKALATEPEKSENLSNWSNSNDNVKNSLL